MSHRHAGLALIVVIGILGVLAVLAAAFVLMAQLERRASQQRVNAARAYLLARSGIEDALARLELGQDAIYGGENWDGDADGLLSTFEATQEVYHPTGVGKPADLSSCPVRHAMRPSFFVGAGDHPATLGIDGRQRGYSGLLTGDYASPGNTYALKVRSGNAGIHVNGGALDALDRDPDGPGGPPETAPLLPDTVPDHRDASMEGPNGFLVRLLNNLDTVVTDGATSNLGLQVVEARPAGGYTSLDELKPVLGQTRFDQFKPYLTLHAWVDPKVVKPQPMDGRPQRWEDIDDLHRAGLPATAWVNGQAEDVTEISGVGTAGGNPRLLAGTSGKGTAADPWVRWIEASNAHEGDLRYPVIWERGFVYAAQQMRVAPPAPEPRAPVSIHQAPGEVLAAAFLGLKGTYLEVWEGSAGWDGGFGWFTGYEGTKTPPQGTYPYPSEATEATPWHRTRVDYGGPRPWYGHQGPQGPGTGGGGGPLVQAAPMGRLRETLAVSPAQAQALALELRRYIAEAGPWRTWGQFDAFLARLPRWEDLNDDDVLDGSPYQVAGSGGTYTRRAYLREDGDSDGRMSREVFTRMPGSHWGLGLVAWEDPGLPRAALGGAVPGLAFPQKDVLRAMANPNTDLNDFNPDANLHKEVDKTDLAGIACAPSSYAHTTELAWGETMGTMRLQAVGRIFSRQGRLVAARQLGGMFRVAGIFRDTTQADFLRDGAARHLLPPPPAPYALSGGRALAAYPEPPAGAGASWDGQVGLGFIGASPGPDETLRGYLFDTADASATGDAAVPDRRGSRGAPLLASAGGETGQVFPDGVYAERDRALRYSVAGNLPELEVSHGVATPDTTAHAAFYVGCWVKPNWFPEASPRARALISLSRGAEATVYHGHGEELPINPYDVPEERVPVDDVPIHPVGLYFVPARNSAWQDRMGTYDHSAASTRGKTWPCHALLWGTTHSLFASNNLNQGGVGVTDQASLGTDPWKYALGKLGQQGVEPYPETRPIGRLQAHRWTHVGVVGDVGKYGSSYLALAWWSNINDRDGGGGWSHNGFGSFNKALGALHADGTPNHLRFGEVAGLPNMNYAADATFANVRAGGRRWQKTGNEPGPPEGYRDFFWGGASSPALLGRYLKEDGAAYVSSTLPEGLRPLSLTWTEVPCDLWFDEDKDGWLGDPLIDHTYNSQGIQGIPQLAVDLQPRPYQPRNDQFGLSPAGLPVSLPNGRRDVHIGIEIWHDTGTDDPSDDAMLARFDDPAADNRIPDRLPLLGDPPLPGGLLPDLPLGAGLPPGRFYYKAVFVNEWDADTRANFPLDVTPFLDDVTILYTGAAGPSILAWENGEAD